MGGERLVSARMYTGWRTLWPGLAKNLVDTLGGPAATLGLAFAAFVLAWAVVAVPLIDLAGLMRGAAFAPLALCSRWPLPGRPSACMSPPHSIFAFRSGTVSASRWAIPRAR